MKKTYTKIHFRTYYIIDFYVYFIYICNHEEKCNGKEACL